MTERNTPCTYATLANVILAAKKTVVGTRLVEFETRGCTANLAGGPQISRKRSGPKAYKLDTKIIFRGNPLQGEIISGGTTGDVLESKAEPNRLGLGVEDIFWVIVSPRHAPPLPRVPSFAYGAIRRDAN
jgi:hypothetical protein